MTQESATLQRATLGLKAARGMCNAVIRQTDRGDLRVADLNLSLATFQVQILASQADMPAYGASQEEKDTIRGFALYARNLLSAADLYLREKHEQLFYENLSRRNQ